MRDSAVSYRSATVGGFPLYDEVLCDTMPRRCAWLILRGADNGGNDTTRGFDADILSVYMRVV